MSVKLKHRKLLAEFTLSMFAGMEKYWTRELIQPPTKKNIPANSRRMIANRYPTHVKLKYSDYYNTLSNVFNINIFEF